MGEKIPKLRTFTLKYLRFFFFLLFSFSFARLGTDPKASEILVESSSTEVHLNPNTHMFKLEGQHTQIPFIVSSTPIYSILFLISAVLYNVKTGES